MSFVRKIAMANGIKTANIQETEINLLEQRIDLLEDRLEICADMLMKSGMLESDPHSRYRFVNGLPLQHFPTIEGSEFQDVDESR